MRSAWILVALAGTADAEPPTLTITHEPPPRHLHMRPRRAAAAATRPDPAPAHPTAVAAPPPPRDDGADANQIRDPRDRVQAQINLGYQVDGTASLGPQGFGPVGSDHRQLEYATTRAYGFGEGYASTHGVAIDSLSTYFAGRFLLTNPNTVYAPGAVAADSKGDVLRPPPIGTWFERSGVDPRAAWAEIKDFMPQPWLSPLRIRAGEQYIYGPWVLHFYGTVIGWEGKLVRATVYAGSHVPDYTFDPTLPQDRSGIAGGSLKLDLRDLQTSIPITVSAETVTVTSSGTDPGSQHSQLELDWRPRRDVALIGQARTLDGELVNEHVQLRSRYKEVTNLVFDFTHRSSNDWQWDPTLLENDPAAAKRYLDLGPVLPQITGSARAGTLIAENIDLYLRGAFAVDTAAPDVTKSTYSASYIEGGGALEVRLRRTVAIGVSTLSRQTARYDTVASEIVDHPGVPDAIPINAGSQLGERGFTEVGTTARMSLGARKFSLLLEIYGRRTHYALDYCELAVGATDCQSATDTGIPTVAYRGGGRVQIDAWIGNRLRLFASYDLSTALDFTPDVTGYKSLRLMMEGSY